MNWDATKIQMSRTSQFRSVRCCCIPLPSIVDLLFRTSVHVKCLSPVQLNALAKTLTVPSNHGLIANKLLFGCLMTAVVTAFVVVVMCLAYHVIVQWLELEFMSIEAAKTMLCGSISPHIHRSNLKTHELRESLHCPFIYKITGRENMRGSGTYKKPSVQ